MPIDHSEIATFWFKNKRWMRCDSASYNTYVETFPRRYTVEADMMDGKRLIDNWLVCKDESIMGFNYKAPAIGLIEFHTHIKSIPDCFKAFYIPCP